MGASAELVCNFPSILAELAHVLAQIPDSAIELLKPSAASPPSNSASNFMALHAIGNGLTEVLIGKFPKELFTDNGRATNQAEPDWQNTLTGLPTELYEFWLKHLQARGYKLSFQIVDFPGGMPGDDGITLGWQ